MRFRKAAVLGVVSILVGCGVENAPSADRHEAWSVTLDQRFVDPYPGVTSGVFVCFAYDGDWMRDDDHRQGPGVLIGIDTATGHIAWKQAIELGRGETYDPVLMRGLILIGEGMVFFHGADQALHALDAGTGKEKWTEKNLGNLLGVHPGVLVMSDDKFRPGLRDPATGAVRHVEGLSRADEEFRATVTLS